MADIPVNADPAKLHLVSEKKHGSPLLSCRFDLTGQFVVAGAQDMKVVRFPFTGDAKAEFVAHDSWVRALTFAKTADGPDGQQLITGGYDGRLVWWKDTFGTPTPLRRIEAHRGWIRGMTLTHDRQFLISCGNDGLVKQWKIADGTLVREFAGHDCHVYAAAAHPNGVHLATCDLKCNVIQWDLSTGKEVRRIKAASLHKFDAGFMADYGGFHAMEFSADGKVLAGSGITNVTNAFAGVGFAAAAVIDWEAGTEKTVHLAKSPINGDGWGLILHPQQFVILLSGGGGGGRLYFFKPGEKNEYFTFNLPGTPRDLSMSPDGMHLATAHQDGVVRIWKMGDKAA